MTTIPHFVLLPFMAQGHLIPMVDIAKLLANRNSLVTILLSPYNQNRVKSVLNRAIDSGLNIQILTIQFPPLESGLPEGSENFDMISTKSEAFNFFTAISLLQKPVQDLILNLNPKPDCFIADMCFSWASKVALKLQIPRIIFHGFCCFSLGCNNFARPSKEVQSLAASDFDYFVLPNLPDRIEITRAQLRGTADPWTSGWDAFLSEMKRDEDDSFGMLVNSFEELELEYLKLYKQKTGKKVWCIGPVSLCNENELDKAERGNIGSVDKTEIFNWLDGQELGSVIYVCLGSIAKIPTSQMIEIGLGLELTNRPFLWVVRNPAEDLKNWFAEDKFHKRVNGRGFIIEGWAPQVLILSHPSVGCFMTHCGWNSSLEGITAGLPMITWPVLGEQFCNEKFIVSVIKTGVKSGVELPFGFAQEQKVKEVQVTSDEIKKVIEGVMVEGEEGNERRERARKLGEIARMAVQEMGSSYNNITSLIDDVMNLKFLKKEDEEYDDEYKSKSEEIGRSAGSSILTI